MNSYYVEILVNLFAFLVKVDEKEKQRKIRQNEESEGQTTYQTKIKKTRHDEFQISEKQKETNRHTSYPINKEQKGMWESQAECENMQTQKQKQNSHGKNRQSKKGKQTKTFLRNF